jgi:hypothetical protein
MGQLIQPMDLQAAITPTVVLALFDDQSTGTPDPVAMAEVLDQAEAEVLSYLVGHYPTNPLPPSLINDPLLKRSALDFAIVFAYERHPEYTRTVGESSRVETRFQRATARMQRIQSAMQQPAQTNSPVQVRNPTGGGPGLTAEPSITLNRPDGTSGMGDF